MQSSNTGSRPNTHASSSTSQYEGYDYDRKGAYVCIDSVTEHRRRREDLQLQIQKLKQEKEAKRKLRSYRDLGTLLGRRIKDAEEREQEEALQAVMPKLPVSTMNAQNSSLSLSDYPSSTASTSASMSGSAPGPSSTPASSSSVYGGSSVHSRHAAHNGVNNHTYASASLALADVSDPISGGGRSDSYGTANRNGMDNPNGNVNGGGIERGSTNALADEGVGGLNASVREGDGSGNARVNVNDEEKWSRHILQRQLEIASMDDGRSRREALMELNSSVVRAALDLAQAVVQEIHLPDADKKIKPLRAGLALGKGKNSRSRSHHSPLHSLHGGEPSQYMRDGVLLTVIDDRKVSSITQHTRYLHGGKSPCTELAIKASNNRLRGASAHFQYFYEEPACVVVPLQVLIEYKGFRLHACPFMPVTEAHGKAQQVWEVLQQREKERERERQRQGEAGHQGQHQGLGPGQKDGGRGMTLRGMRGERAGVSERFARTAHTQRQGRTDRRHLGGMGMGMGLGLDKYRYATVGTMISAKGKSRPARPSASASGSSIGGESGDGRYMNAASSINISNSSGIDSVCGTPKPYLIYGSQGQGQGEKVHMRHNAFHKVMEAAGI